jgi:hypothetical protein
MHQFVPRESKTEGSDAPTLAHSAIYDDERAIRAIVDWVRRAERASG